MKKSSHPSAIAPKAVTSASLEAAAAEIRAKLEKLDPANTQPEPVRPRLIRLDNPVIVSGKVSTYIEAEPGRGAYAVQLNLEDATVTTTVALEHCSAISLRCAAYEAAKRILGGQLALVRGSKESVATHYVAPKKRSKVKTGVPDAPTVTRESFWVCEVRGDGAPEFTSDAWNLSFELENSAAFAEFAFHED